VEDLGIPDQMMYRWVAGVGKQKLLVDNVNHMSVMNMMAPMVLCCTSVILKLNS